MASFSIGTVTVELLDGRHPITAVPPSAWPGHRKERRADAVLANLKADDGLRAPGSAPSSSCAIAVRSRVTGGFADKVRAWTAVEPRGRELWIDTDGVVGGFIGATPRVLGYLGPDPESNIARGFFAPHYCVTQGDAVVDLDTGERRMVPALTTLDDGSSLRVATYGDVLLVDDVHGVERVATVTPAEWFPGHLG